MSNINKNKSGGFTLLIAMVITSTLLLVSTGIVSVAVKEAFLASAGRESQFAFYAADTGIECAIYWDVRHESGVSAFASSTANQISCNDQVSTVGGGPASTFTFDFDPLDDGSGQPYCATVTVTKIGSTTRMNLWAIIPATSPTGAVSSALSV